MDDQVPQVSYNPNNPPLKRSAGKTILGIVAAVVVLAGACYGVYAWQHGKVDNLNKQLSAAKSSASSMSMQNSSSSNTTTSSYAQKLVAGYPISAPKTKVLTTLSLPTGTDAVNYTEDLNTQAKLEGKYTESFNDLIGRWLTSPVGVKSDGTRTNYTPNEVYISVMKDWASKADTADVSYPSMGESDTMRMTVAQKTDFISKLKTDSATCAKDSTKGFATADKVYNICYTLSSPKAQDGDWVAVMTGYGEIKGAPTYFHASFSLPNSTYKTDLTSYINALKHTTTVVSATNS